MVRMDGTVVESLASVMLFSYTSSWAGPTERIRGGRYESALKHWLVEPVFLASFNV